MTKTTGITINRFPNYLITNDGRIWSKKWSRWMKPFENCLKHRSNDQYYLRIALFDKNNKRRKIMVHRLVAMAFIPNPKNKRFINHLNGNKHDNRIENLRWVTARENCHHAVKHNLHFKKLSDNQVKEIRTQFKGVSHHVIAKRYGVSRRLIDQIIRKEKRVLVE